MPAPDLSASQSMNIPAKLSRSPLLGTPSSSTTVTPSPASSAVPSPTPSPRLTWSVQRPDPLTSTITNGYRPATYTSFASIDRRLKLVIGLDYGTSHSGAVYALWNPHESEPLNSIDINVVRDWPSIDDRSYRQASDKVPSDIGFSTNNEADTSLLPHCGFEIPGGVEALQWVKLLLEPHRTKPRLKASPQIKRVEAALRELNMTPVGAAAEYLRWLWQHIKTKIAGYEEDDQIFEREAVTVVMTVPAVWSEKARDNTLLAAERAGITNNGVTLKFITEPEAAAIFALKTKAEKRKIKAGECFILCDAGGGTVDVVSYRVRTIQPFTLDQVVIGDGDMCGSVFIDIEFREQLRGFLPEGVFEELPPQTMKKLLHDFEYTIKRNYQPSKSDRGFTIDLPGVKDNKELGISGGAMQIDSAILEASFEAIMGQVMVLIDGQREGLEKAGLKDRLKAILLVGGFGGSKFLKDRISQEYTAEQNIEIWQADRSWTSVAAGAVRCELMGLGEVKPVNTRLSRVNYGTTYNTIFNPQCHDPTDRYECRLTGIIKARNQIQWFIRRGQEIKSDSPPAVSDFSLLLNEDDILLTNPGGDITWNVVLVSSNEDNPPERRTPAVKNFVEITCRFNKSIIDGLTPIKRGGKRSWKLRIAMEVTMGDALLGFRCLVNGKEVGRTTAAYRDVLD